MAPYHKLKMVNRSIIMLTLVTLVACSSRASVNTESTTTPVVPSLESNTQTVVVSETQSTDTPLVRSYRTILLLERAADLIITFLGNVQAGSISGDDPSVRQPYTLAFPVAIESYNQSTPPAELSMIWANVTTVAVEYNKVYALIQQGKPVSSTDYYNLKSFRQILTNAQSSVEVSLSNNGMGQDFYSAEKLSVDQSLQQAYEDTPIPTTYP